MTLHITHQDSKKFLCIAAMIAIMSGCATKPFIGLQLNDTHLKERQIQMKRYEMKDEAALLASASAVLQDMGYNLDESETKLGVISSSKQRDARTADDVIGKIFLSALTGVAQPINVSQTIRVSLFTSKSAKGGYILRATFQRIVMNAHNQVSAAETLLDEKLYTEFFSKLSKAVFLEAQDI